MRSSDSNRWGRIDTRDGILLVLPLPVTGTRACAHPSLRESGAPSMTASALTNAPRTGAVARAGLAFRWQDYAFLGVLLLSLVLRIWRLNDDQFLMDSAGTAMLARSVVDLHGFPVTGINSSIGSFTPPLPVYIYMLPVLLGGPYLGMLFTVLICVAAIAGTYLLCRRYISPTVGLIAALLFAVSWGPVNFSRFIWQPNLQTPLVVWYIALLFAGVAGRRKGWLAWALPVWCGLLQAHPVTASLGPLLVVVWLLAPETVRRRDVVIGIMAFVVLFIPTAIFELTDSFFDIHVYRGLTKTPSTITATVFKQFFVISGLPQTSPWSGAPAYHALMLVWDGVLVCGLLYLTIRVLRPLPTMLAHASAAIGWRARLGAALAWMRASERTRWRVDLVLLAWPSLLVLAQVRHSSPVNLHYVIATYPAQFIAVGILFYDAAVGIRNARSVLRVATFGSMVVSAVLVGAICVAQVSGVLYTYSLNAPQSLGAMEADISAAQVLAHQRNVGLVVFDPSYFALEPIRYLLNTQYHFTAPTEMLENGLCLPALPSADTPVLYMMGGPTTSQWESILRATPGVTNLLARNPGGGFFRAYLVAPSHLGVRYSATSASGSGPLATFGGALTVNRIGSVSVPSEPAGAVALETRALKTPTSAPYHSFYGFAASVTTAQNQPLVSDSMPCDIAQWMPGQLVYYLLPNLPTAALSAGNIVTLSSNQLRFDQHDPTLGSLRLTTALDMVTMHYTVPATANDALAPDACADGVRCSATTGATVTLK